MSQEQSDAPRGAKPPKELRTVRRDGDIVTEDCEWLNSDGTVTKSITVTDEKTGQKQVSFYKMDKSGIVRKLYDMDQKKEDLLQQLRKQLAETKEKVRSMKEQTEKSSKPAVYETRVPHYGSEVGYSRRVEGDEPDKHEMAYNLRNINKPIELTPKQQQLIREHKENILNYGTQKLIKQLNKKLREDNFNESYKLTDEQKDKVIEYGIRKLHKLLEKNLDEERLIYDVMSFNPDFGEVDLSGRGTRQITGDQSVSFSLNPYKEIAPEEIAKPVSFSMRPEKPNKPLPEPDKYTDQKVIHNGYKALWNRLMKPESIVEKEEDVTNDNENSKDEKYNNSCKNDDSDDDKQDYRDKYKKIKESVKQIIADDELYKKSPLSKEEKEDVIDYALKQVRSVIKDSLKGEKLSSSSKKNKINLAEYFDEDEIFEYGRRALKKLVRRSLKGFDVNQEILRNEKLDDPELAVRRDAFFQYLGDIVEGRVKESDPLPLPLKIKKSYQEEEPEQQTKWDYNSFLSSIFGQKEKNKILKAEEKPKEHRDKLSDIESLFSWIRGNKEGDTDKEKLSTQQHENVPKVKPRFYQLEPLDNSKNEQNVSEIKGFDLKSMLKKIQEAAVKKFSDPEPTKNIENASEGSIPYKEHDQTNVNINSNFQEKELKQEDIDTALSRIRQNSNEASNTKRVVNKPPYLKERISGLDSIPRLKISTASPVERNTDHSDEVLFQLKPHNYDNTNKQEDKSRSLGNQRVETGKPCSHEQDFQPWWFESPESFVKKTLSEKPLVKEGFIDPPMIKSSFSTGGNGFSTVGSFLPGNILE